MTEMHVTRWGNSGPRIVLVHGGAQGSGGGAERSFGRQKPLGDEGLQLILPDRPGHGLSPDPGRPDDADADGTLVAGLIEDGTHLVGHSFGGCVALDAAIKRPDAVRSLMLIEPAMHMFAAGDPRVRPFLLGMLWMRLTTFSPRRLGEKIVVHLGIPPEVRGNAGPAEMAQLGRAVGRIKLPSRATLAAQLAEIKRRSISFLVVTGGWSPAFEASSDRVAEAGGGTRAVIRSGHHFPQFIADQFNPLLRDFLKQADSARP